MALARSRAYGLLSELYLVGVTPGNLARVQAVPELAGELRSPFEEDEAAADHHALFRFNVYPYQSIFLDPDGLLGGPMSERVARAYARYGYQPETSGESADHVGFELGFLAFLCAAEAEARQDGDRSGTLRRLQEQQMAFMAAQLLTWIGPLTLAIRQQGQPFFQALADVTLDLLQEQTADLTGNVDRSPQEQSATADMVDLLGQEETGLKEIANFLLTPIYSGIYLSRDDIGRLARRQAVPRGFGDRGQLLLNLLRTAANYDAVGDVIDDLAALARSWYTAYGEMVARPGIGEFANCWRTRAAGTIALLDQMQRRIKTLT